MVLFFSKNMNRRYEYLYIWDGWILCIGWYIASKFYGIWYRGDVGVDEENRCTNPFSSYYTPKTHCYIYPLIDKKWVREKLSPEFIPSNQVHVPGNFFCLMRETFTYFVKKQHSDEHKNYTEDDIILSCWRFR